MKKKVKIAGHERRQGKLPPRNTKGQWTKKRKAPSAAQAPLFKR